MGSFLLKIVYMLIQRKYYKVVSIPVSLFLARFKIWRLEDGGISGKVPPNKFPASWSALSLFSENIQAGIVPVVIILIS